MNARFSMPEFYMNKEIYVEFVSIYENHPEILLPHTELSAVFGVFPGCIWNGGGLTIGGNISKEEIIDTINFYNFELGLPLRFTFTNPLVGPIHYNDTYCNIIAEAGNNGQNQILTSNLGLEKYLRENYKNYKYCRSIVASRDIPYLLSSEYGDYHLTVIQRKLNNNWEFLDQIPDIDRPSIEFLCNDPCPDNCPRLYTHYRDFARAQLECANGGPECTCSMIDVKGEFPGFYMTQNLRTYISREMIDNDYLPKGYCEFKCSGRQSHIALIVNLLKYLIKPEYREDMLANFLSVIGIT